MGCSADKYDTTGDGGMTVEDCILQRPPGAKETSYKMKEKTFSWAENYEVENDEGVKIFKIKGKKISCRDTLKVKDCLTGEKLCIIQQEMCRCVPHRFICTF